VSDFLFRVERVWPSNLEFSIEFTLEFLMINKFNHDKVVNLIKFRDPSFSNFIKGIIDI